MQITSDDVVIYVYNLGVVLSSAWAIQGLITGERLLLIAASSLLALGWTVYFWVSIAPRIHVERGARPDEEEDSRTTGPREDRANPDDRT